MSAAPLNTGLRGGHANVTPECHAIFAELDAHNCGAKSSSVRPRPASRSSARPAQQPRICDRNKGNTLTTELGGAGRLRIKMSMARRSRGASLPGRTCWQCSFEKSAEHQPLHRQSDRYARGHDLSLSALANQVGAWAAARNPLPADRGECDFPLITCVTTLGKGKTDPDHQNVKG